MTSSLESTSSLQDSDSDEDLKPFVPMELTSDPMTPAVELNLLNVPDSDDERTGHTPEGMTPLTQSEYSDHDDLESDEGKPLLFVREQTEKANPKGAHGV